MIDALAFRAARTPLRERITVPVPAICIVLVCAGIGAAMSRELSYAAVVIAGVVAALLALQWRHGVTVLLVALPFSGVPAFVAGTPGLALRDVFIVAPLYIAFAVEMTHTRGRLLPNMGVGAAALAVFSVLVVLQTLRSETVLAGAIGARVWLAYIPMLAIGYHFVREERDFEAIVRLTALLGLVPAALAIGECAFAVRQGDFGPFESIYGSWQLSDTQRFVVFSTSQGHIDIPRVPATFTGVSQYFGFSLVAFAAALSLAFRNGSARWSACAAILAAGALASGARAAYVAVPAIFAVSLLFSGVRVSREGALLAGTALIVLAVVAMEAGAANIAVELPAHLNVTLRTAFNELRSSLTLVGHGTGWDTNAALRYGGVTDRRYIENWYAKVALELGVIGLIAVLAAFGGIVWTLIRGSLRLDAPARRMIAPVIALVIVVMALLFKGPYIDLDPLNVYVWLLIGAVLGLYRRVSRERGAV